MNDQLPYQVTHAAKAYEGIEQLPVAVVLDHVRSAYNVGSFFRTCDAAGVEKLYLTGITGTPPHKEILKTALGAEKSVPWEHRDMGADVARELRARGYEIAAIETSVHAVDLFDWVPSFPVCLIFGHEVDGLSAELAAMADRHIRIPMLGVKHSLNVGVAGGVTIYELLRKYKALVRANS